MRGGQRDPRRQAADAAREGGPALEQLRAAGAVAEAEREEEGGGDQRAARWRSTTSPIAGAARRGRPAASRRAIASWVYVSPIDVTCNTGRLDTHGRGRRAS